MSEDSVASYDIGHLAKREMLVRCAKAPPVNGREDRWLLEGPRDWSDLDTVREGLPGDDTKTPPVETRESEIGSVT
jgi:hypothetical protein